MPSRVERVIRRATRARISTDSVPITAEANRQPKGVMPNIHSPMAISHFPAGGWATKLPPFAQMSRFGGCWSSRLSAFLTVLCSYPNFSSAYASLA